MNWKRWIDSMSLWWSEVHFVETPLPGAADPFALLNNGIESLRSAGANTQMVRYGARSACELARNACRHVDIAAQRNPSAWRAPAQGISSDREREALLALAERLSKSEVR